MKNKTTIAKILETLTSEAQDKHGIVILRGDAVRVLTGYILSLEKKIDVKELARQIRLTAIQSPNLDVMSCEFGNWFAPKVEKILKDFLDS